MGKDRAKDRSSAEGPCAVFGRSKHTLPPISRLVLFAVEVHAHRRAQNLGFSLSRRHHAPPW